MDDTLEQPTALAQSAQQPLQTQDDQDLGDQNDPSEDAAEAGLDWAKILPPAASRPVIPRRGEKEFEPRVRGEESDPGPSTSAPSAGTALQQHVLNQAREAMFDALRATRTVSSKNISYGIWYPNLSRTYVTIARGIHFSALGHSAPRPTDDDGSKIQKRLELLPEEAIYLVERGSMLCWKHVPSFCQPDAPKVESTVFECPIPGPPMSVQQVYTEMVGREGLTLEKYQVYAYLKRLGYAVMRAEPPDPYYPIPAPFVQRASPSFLHRILSAFSRLVVGVAQFILRRNAFDWWHPVKFSRWSDRDKNYPSLFKSLRFIPSGHSVQLHESTTKKRDTPYRIFYNVYKPSTSLKKSAPCKPDFQIVVVNARTTPIPTLYELTNLFDQVPEAPRPLPRRRQGNSAQTGDKGGHAPSTVKPPLETTRKTTWYDWLPFRLYPSASLSSSQTSETRPPPKPNPFVSLKTGKKIIVIAAVDAGNISFFRFGQGVFEEWPMVV